VTHLRAAAIEGRPHLARTPGKSSENFIVNMRALRILLSGGSSLSAREAVAALELAGLRVELVARFSRFVRHVHPAPPSGSDPDGYLSAVLEVVARRSIGVLMPVHV
jgi:hypothetical protein